MADGMPNAVDAQVQACISRGEYRGALELLARTYLDTVYRYCLRMLHEDTGRARDMTQQVFEEVCKGITSYRSESSVKTWLLAIARNQCRKDIDTQARRSTMLRDNVTRVEAQVHTTPPAESETALLSQEWLHRLQAGLARLAPEDRSLLVMRFGIGVSNELSTTEIAHILGISRASAYRKVHEALAYLRRIMHDETG
jgi:RNA polymerase sigma-70 factor (ECF subfamily)